MTLVPVTVNGVEIDRVAILQALKLNPKDPKTQALILICEQYGLDPLLKHMVLVDGNPYVTRDGYLHLAHSSGKFDGIEVVDTGETATHYTAKVAVYRKDMSRPVTYAGRYPKDGSNRKYGPEMAVKTAEVAALRRAFNVTGVGAADEQWDTATQVAAPSGATPAIGPGVELAHPDLIAGLIDRLNALTGADRAAFKATFGCHPRELPAWLAVEAEAFVTTLETSRPEPPPAAAAVPDPVAGDAGRPFDEPAPEPEPAEAASAGRRKLSPAQRLHIDAKALGFSEDDLDVLIANASAGRTSSANDLTDRERDEVASEMDAMSRSSKGAERMAAIRAKVAEHDERTAVAS